MKLPDAGGLAVAYALASAIVEATARLNGKKLENGKLVPSKEGKDASARHLAATAIYLLNKFWISDRLRDAASGLLNDQPANPYFEFLAHGSSPQMLDWILDQCPDFDHDIQTRRFQWAWERQDSKLEAQESMYWDCIFAGNLYFNKNAFSFPMDLSNQFLPSFDLAWSDIGDAANALNDFLSTLVSELTNLGNLENELKRQLKYLESIASGAWEGSIPKYDPDKGTITVQPPGTPKVEVDTKKGNVSVGGVCIGLNC